MINLKNPTKFLAAVKDLEALPVDAEKSKLAKIIKRILFAYGDDINQLASSLGVTVPSIYRWRAGNVRPRESIIGKLEDLLKPSQPIDKVILMALIEIDSPTLEELKWLMGAGPALGVVLDDDLALSLITKRRAEQG